MRSINEAFQLFLRKTFDIRNGELPRASLMQLNIFLIITTLLIVKPTVNGLFLSKFGVENLPYAFILVAVVAAVVTSLYAIIVRRVSLYRIINGTLLFSVGSLLFFGVFLRFDFFESFILFLFYLWVAIFALLTTSQFWVLANIVFNAREAKRLFGFVGAGAIAGGIFGGYLTSALAQFMSSENLPFVGAFFIGLCLPVNWTIWKKYITEKQSTFQQDKRWKGFGEHPFTLVRKSRHLTYLASIVGVSVMVAKLVDYQFGGIAAAQIPDPDELTAFFGFWLSTFSVISLFLQLFVTRRVVGTYGVGASLLFLPGFILAAVIALLLFPGVLAAAVFLKMADGGLKQSVNKAAMELLIMPVPIEVKNQTKAFIDVFVDSLATGISGAILFFLVKGLNLPSNAINGMIVGLLLLWFYLISKVNKEYLRSFREKIDENKNHDDKKEMDFTKESVLNGLKKVLENGSEKQVLVILEKVNGFTHKKLFDSIKKLLNHPSDSIKAAAIRHLHFYKKSEVDPVIEVLTMHKSQKVKIAAFEYLLTHAKENRVALMESFLQQEDYKVRGAALIVLAAETRDNPILKKQFKLTDRIQYKLDKLTTVTDKEELEFRTITALKAIGQANIAAFYPFLLSSFSNENKTIARQAILEAGNTLDPSFIRPLVQTLTNPKLKRAAQSALVHYGNGIVSTLEMMVLQGDSDLEETRMIPFVIKKVGVQQSVNFLFKLLENQDLRVQHEALRGLNYLRNNFAHLKFNRKKINRRVLAEAQTYREVLAIFYTQNKIHNRSHKIENAEITEARAGLIHLLEKRLERNLERIFRLLGLNHRNGDIYIIYKGIRSRKPDLRLNALEFMDNLLAPHLKNMLIPIVEISMVEKISEEGIDELHLHIPDEKECFQLLLNGEDPRMKMAVLYLLEQLKEKKYKELIQEQIIRTDKKVEQ